MNKNTSPSFCFLLFLFFFFFFFSRGSLMGEEPVKVPSKAECRVIGSFFFFILVFPEQIEPFFSYY